MNNQTGQRQAGFTLYEVMIVVGIVGILLVAAGMSWRGQMPRHRVADTADKLQAHMRAARVHALSKARPVTLTLDTAQRRLTTTVDTDGSGVIDAGETATVPLAGAGGVTLRANHAAGVFLPGGGFQGNGGYWKVTVAHAGTPDVYVYVLAGGQVQVTSETLE